MSSRTHLTLNSSVNAIQGHYYDRVHSAPYPCTLTVDQRGEVTIDLSALQPCHFSQLKVASRVGRIPRVIEHPSGGYFETPENDTVDQLVRQFSASAKGFTPHGIESHPYAIFLSLLLILGISVGAILWGIPALSGRLALALPARASIELAQGAMERLDQVAFKPSQLSAERQQRLQRLFAEQLKPTDREFNYRLLFRNGGIIGANALALPDGTVVVTDQLVELAEDDLEILAILYHEAGHVEQRHTLRRVFESMGTGALFIWISGDVTVLQELVVLLPSILMETNYSRDHEWEADSYALEQMQRAGYDPNHFSNLLQRMVDAEQRELKKSPPKASEGDPGSSNRQAEDDEGLLRYLSTHPASKRRIDRFREAEESSDGDRH